MIDTHIHLYDSIFDNDRDEVIRSAKDVGIQGCILPGIDSSYISSLLECAKKYPNFAFPAIGLHPTSVKNNWEDELCSVLENLDKHKFYAIGEIGIDCFWSKDFIVEQKIVFEKQLMLALEKNLPVIIHSRDAWNEIFEVFDLMISKVNKLPKGIFHAFSGSYEIYKRILSYGEFKLGIGGVITYKNSNLPDVVKNVPISDIVLETDAPWLTPAPHRGKRNELAYLEYISKKISLAKNINHEEVIRITTHNAINLFKIPSNQNE